MELVNENSFNPTPKLKSSPIPISFVPFNEDDVCFCCKRTYTETCFQKYCKRCLSQYINKIANSFIEISDNFIEIVDYDAYLDMRICASNSECNEHETSRSENSLQNIQEWCENCSGISYFKQIYSIYCNFFETITENDCKLCGKLVKLVCQNSGLQRFKVCSNCYLISSGWIESSLTKNPIPILHLPWWDNSSLCIACDSKLKFTSGCQKYCARCCIIYIGCRYCLTTNIIFGFADKSQCKKCRRITIDITNISSGNSDLDDFLYDPNFCNNLQLDKAISEIPMDVYQFIRANYNRIQPETIMEWVPYSQISDMKQIAIGGFGVIYKATWLDGPLVPHGGNNYRQKNQTVIVKRLEDSQNISKSFLNEVLYL